MVFKIKLISSAQKDLESALEYYQNINPQLTKKFYDEFIVLNSLLEQNPFFEVKYNTIRTYKLKAFPYLVHFIVEEELKEVILIAIVFGKMKKTNFNDRLPNI